MLGRLLGLFCWGLLRPGAAGAALHPEANASLHTAAAGVGQAPDSACLACPPGWLQERAAKENLVFVSAYDDPLVSTTVLPGCLGAHGLPGCPPRGITQPWGLFRGGASTQPVPVACLSASR
jgi:hypothetical protein